ncbi:MAG: hypothetical protein Q9195_004039 [Heterodermia aff. obscurata]
MPLSHVSLFNKQKRKREDRSSSGSLAAEARSPKRRNERTDQKPNAPSESVHVIAPPTRHATTLDPPPSPAGEADKMENLDTGSAKPESSHTTGLPSCDIMNLTPLQQTIESQFSLEILLKHRELRLIDQELAKCQVALEQLRRCHVMPYPASSSDPETMQMVSRGVGPAYNTQAPSPTPWGISDGPYSRHYAKWLIPDSAFGESVAEDLHPQLGGKALPDRATRGSMSSKAHAGGYTRGQRGSTREKLQALPHGYPEPKENKGPMIVKRSTDGKMVKLVCLDCRREDFNSAQGFINHCRIAHSRGFASHDAAAIACGEETDADATGSTSGLTAGSSNSTAGLVHPLIRSALLTNSTPQISPATQQRRKRVQAKALVASQLSGKSGGPAEMPSTPQAGHAAQLNFQAPSPFKPSPQTPHLSALFAKIGRGGNLEEMVTEAMYKPEPETSLTDGLDDDEDDDEVEESVEQPAQQRSHGTLGVIRGGGRLPARSGISPAPLERTPSAKGVTKPIQRRPDNTKSNTHSNPHITSHNRKSLPEPVYVARSHHPDHHPDASPPDASPTLNLSPNTIESHQAPSLVSDDGDYENTYSESETPSSAVVSEDEDNFEVEVKDSEHHSMDLDTAGASSTTSDYGMSKPHHHHHPPQPPAPRRPSAMRDPGERGGLAQRRVSFQSPMPSAKGGSRRKGGK